MVQSIGEVTSAQATALEATHRMQPEGGVKLSLSDASLFGLEARFPIQFRDDRGDRDPAMCAARKSAVLKPRGPCTMFYRARFSGAP